MYQHSLNSLLVIDMSYIFVCLMWKNIVDDRFLLLVLLLLSTDIVLSI